MLSTGEKILWGLCVLGFVFLGWVVGMSMGYDKGREHTMAESAVLESTGHEIRTDALGRKVWVKVEP